MQDNRPRFVFNCQKCGQCCEKDWKIKIFFDDLEKWIRDGTIYRILSNLVVIEDDNITTIQLERKDHRCTMYDSERKECLIYNNRPIICNAYPLKWDGKSYLIRDEECSGLNKGVMTQESLESIRNSAKREHIEEERTSTTLQIIQAILLRDIIKKSEAELNKLSEQEREKIREIFRKDRPEQNV